MEMTAANWLIIIVGILICFMGICFKRVFLAILGFIWGSAFAYIVLLLIALSGNSTVQDMDDTTAIILVLILAAVVAALSIVLERILLTIRAFLISFIISVIILGALRSSDSNEALILICALILSVIISGVIWIYYRYAFIIECAITGAIMINHVGLMGGNGLSGIVAGSYGGYRSSDNSIAVLLTFVCAIAGIIVQSKILHKIENGTIAVKSEGKKPDLNNLNNIGSLIFKSMPASKIKKADAAALRQYEKYLILAPVAAFFVIRLFRTVSLFDYSMTAWNILWYLQLLFSGIFEGALIYFVIYYETGVAAIYQLLWFCWIPAEIIYRITYQTSSGMLIDSDFRYNIISLLQYALIWGILYAIDYFIKNEMAEIIVMCLAVIMMVSGGLAFLMWNYWGFEFSSYNIFHWVVIIGTVFLLRYLRQTIKDGRCRRCGVETITGDSYCRNCGEKL